MNVFHMVIWIVAIVAIASVLEKYLKVRAKEKSNNEVSDDTLQKMEALEERIQVLERIVTENKFDLRKEINDL
ncbi:MAG: hypothetical protein QNJ05_01335 [Woeseiaceae bacterium]|nr:hypothetical protein [Woeseiaceae bacterium]